MASDISHVLPKDSFQGWKIQTRPMSPKPSAKGGIPVSTGIQALFSCFGEHIWSLCTVSGKEILSAMKPGHRVSQSSLKDSLHLSRMILAPPDSVSQSPVFCGPVPLTAAGIPYNSAPGSCLLALRYLAPFLQQLISH